MDTHPYYPIVRHVSSASIARSRAGIGPETVVDACFTCHAPASAHDFLLPDVRRFMDTNFDHFVSNRWLNLLDTSSDGR